MITHCRFLRKWLESTHISRFVPAITIISLVILTSCFEDDSPRPEEKRGCTDSKALNQDFQADVNDGSCKYSTVTFYAKFGFFNGIPISSIDVSVNGGNIGAITATYPNGPGNCSASGTVKYDFGSGDSIDWNTVVFLANGASIFNSGSISPSSFQECIRVNVTQ